MAETRRRVDAADESLEVTQFDAPHRFKARYCAVNRGLYLQGALFGPAVIRLPPQPEDQACANRAPPTPGIEQ